jgi:hypothetical protein
MNTEDVSEGNVFQGGYMPYFYQSGRFLAYGTSHKGGGSEGYSVTVGGYDFTSDLLKKRRQTVDQVIGKGYFAIPKGTPETAIISDKKHTFGQGLDDIISQIRGRYALFEKNVYDIEQAKCGAITELFTREAQTAAPADSRQNYSLNKQLQELYQQQRSERVMLWQDISKLRQTLPETAQQYLTSYRKVAMLADGKGGDL